MTLILDKCEGYCRGVDGRAGPNLACEGCERAVATRLDDRGMWQTVWLEPHAVVRRSSGRSAGPPPDWDDLERAEHRVPPVELDGSWSRRWEAAVGVALAHLVAVTEDRPVTLPAGPVAELLGHAVDRYLPTGPGTRSVGLAGPGIRPPRSRPDVLLVPRHPLTGASWRQPGHGGLWCRWTAESGPTSPTRARPHRCPRPGASRRASCSTTTPSAAPLVPADAPPTRLRGHPGPAARHTRPRAAQISRRLPPGRFACVGRLTGESLTAESGRAPARMRRLRRRGHHDRFASRVCAGAP